MRAVHRILGNLLFLLIITAVLPTFSAAELTDINGHSAYDDIVWAVNRGIIHGDEDGKFYPDATVTEAEFAAMLVRCLRDADVPAKRENEHWAQNIYRFFGKYEIPLSGYADDKVKDAPLTREKAAKIIAAKNGFNLTEKQAAYYMYENGISFSDEDVEKTYLSFGPELPFTRAEASAFFKKLSEIKGSTKFLGLESQKGPDEFWKINGIVEVPLIPAREIDFKVFNPKSETNEDKTADGNFSSTIIEDWFLQPASGINQLPNPAAWTKVKLPYHYPVRVRPNNCWFGAEIVIPNFKDNRVFLKIQDIQWDAAVFVNNEKVQEVQGPDGVVEITDYVTAGEKADVLIWVTRMWNDVENNRQQDYFRDRAAARGNPDFTRSALGISGYVELISKSSLGRIDNLFIETSYREKKLKLHVDADVSDAFTDARLKVQIEEIDGSSEGLPAVTVPIKSGAQVIEIPWENPVLWELGAGYLYNCKISIVDSEENLVDRYKTTRFGFREIWRDERNMILNGHPIQFNPIMYPMNVGKVKMYEGMGFNALMVQPNQGFWYSNTGTGVGMFPNQVIAGQLYMSEELFDYADERGLAVFMPAPSISNVDNRFAVEEGIQKRYREFFNMWVRRDDMQNRPGVLCWIPSMNTGDLYDPTRIGRIDFEAASKANQNVPKIVAERIIKDIDPTRLVYNHGGEVSDVAGLAGDIGTLNKYPNHMNFQELEEYLTDWYNNGNKPWGAVEFGLGFPVDYMNHARIIPQFTEYGARYYGDEAYAAEKEEYISTNLEYLKQLTGSIEDLRVFDRTKVFVAGVNHYSRLGFTHRAVDRTIFGRMIGDAYKQVIPSWKAFGLNYGAVLFLESVGVGEPPGWVSNVGAGEGNFSYKEIANYENSDQLREKQPWSSELYDAYKEAYSSFTAFIGGSEENFTLKDCNFVSGETIEKTIVSVWNLHYSQGMRYEWKVTCDGDVIAQESETITLNPGDIIKKPISFKVPVVKKRTEAKMSLTIYNDVTDAVEKTDEFEFAFFPRFEKVGELKQKWGIYDTTGKSTAELEKIGFSAKKIDVGDSLEGIDCLIIGTGSAIDLAEKPYTPEDIRNGLRVIYMEQYLDVLEGIGFRAQDTVSRIAFQRFMSHPVWNGVEDKDLNYWRGAGNLVGEFSSDMRSWSTSRALHYKNSGSVASVVIETPHYGAFTPIADCEFDLTYSPLLSFSEGEGEIIFSQFDFNGRLDVEPVAARLAVNLIKYMDEKEVKSKQDKEIAYLGESTEDIEFFKTLGLKMTNVTNLSEAVGKLVVVGSYSLNEDLMKKLVNFAEEGGEVFVLPQSAQDLKGAKLTVGFNLEQRNITQVKPDKISKTSELLKGMGPNLVHFRKFIDVTVFTNTAAGENMMDGMVWRLNANNGGSVVFSQLDWREITKDTENLNLKDNAERSTWNLTKYYRHLLVNMGACTDEEIFQSMFNTKLVLAEQMIYDWLLADKTFFVGTDRADGKFFGLANETEMDKWIAEAEKNPSAKSPANWNPIETPENGYINLFDKLDLPASTLGSVAYLMTNVYSSAERDVIMKFRADYWARIYINGELAVDHSEEGRGGSATATVMEAKGKLKKGWNRIVVKLAAGSSGIAFGSIVDDPGDARMVAVEDASNLEPPKDILPLHRLALGDNVMTILEACYGGKFYLTEMLHNHDPYEYYPW